MSFFRLLNTKDNILKNVLVTKQLLDHIDYKNTMEVNEAHHLFGYPYSSNPHLFDFNSLTGVLFSYWK